MLALLLSSSAAAQGSSTTGSIYCCRDHAGRTITSDRPIPDCAGVMRELGASGIVKREIAPPLTPSSSDRRRPTISPRRAAEESAREKRRRDIRVADRVPERGPDRGGPQARAGRRRTRASATSHARLAELAKERAGLQQEAVTYKGKTMPPLFKRKMDDNQALIDDEEASMKMRQTDVERINARYDDDRNRFRDLNGARK